MPMPSEEKCEEINDVVTKAMRDIWMVCDEDIEAFTNALNAMVAMHCHALIKGGVQDIDGFLDSMVTNIKDRAELIGRKMANG